MTTQRLGTLYGVSAGPGDPELITLKGLRLIQSAAVVAFPAGKGDRPGVAQRIIAPWLQPHQIQLPLTFPYTQDSEALATAWATAAATVAQHLQQHDVVFVSEGDVSFYSTFTYLAESLRQQLPTATITAVPGVCSPLAAAAALGLPLTLGDQRLTVLPALYSAASVDGSKLPVPSLGTAGLGTAGLGTAGLGTANLDAANLGPLKSGVSNLETALDISDVVVLMKVSSVYEKVWQVLQNRQLLETSSVVEWATGEQQTLYRGLGDRPGLSLSYFSLMIIEVSPSRYGRRAPANPSLNDQ